MHNNTYNTQQYLQKNNLQASPQLPYKQFFQCTCSQVFNSLNQYQFHIANQNHQDLYHMSSINQNPIIQQVYNPNHIQQQPITVPISCPEQYSISNQNQPNITNLNNLNIYNQNKLPNSIYFNKKSYQFPNFPIQKPIFQPYQQQFTRQSQLQQKQQSFKYIQAYYASKMAPYYRQFDIDPQKPFSNKKHTYQNRDPFSISSRNLRIQQNPSKFTRSEATNDLNKILQELGVRMIPVQNGIVEFLYLFATENLQKISQIKDDNMQKIQKKLQENINKFTIICYENKKDIPKSDLFMDSDMDFTIKMFVQFLKEILRQNQLWIGYLMLIPIIQGILKFYQQNKDNLESNLKLIDFPLLLSSIKIQDFTNYQNLPIKIQADKITQFLVWFTQWYTMVQLVKSKWSIDYIEFSYDQIHYINRIYQDNVNKYRKCVIDKQVQYGKRYKKKIIEKERQKERTQRQRRKQQKYLRKFTNKYDPIYGSIGDFNLQKTNTFSSKSFYNESKRKANYNDSQFNFEGENYPFNRLTNTDSDINKRTKLKQNQRNITESSQVNDIYTNKLHERAEQERRKRNYKSMLENQYMNSRIDSNVGSQRDDLEDDEMKEAYIAAFRSQYVSYFSPESQQARRKEEEKWNIKAQRLKEIIKNPQLLKPEVYASVSRQLQEVNQLVGLVRVDFRLYNCYQQQILKRMTHKNIKPKSVSQNLSNIQPIPVINNQTLNKRISDKSDPFIIQKNYRFRNNYSLYSNKSQMLAKSHGESSQYEVKNYQQINSRFQIHQKIMKLNNQKPNSESQIQNDKQKDKDIKMKQKENKKDIRYEGQIINDFLDQLL